MSPYRYAHKHDHVDKCRETHRKGSQEQALMGMAKNRGEGFGTENIAQAGYEREEDEEAEIEDEENDGYDLQPVAIVGELMEQNRQDASAHCDDEPADVKQTPRLAIDSVSCCRDLASMRYTYEGVKFLMILRKP
jgi:hypothetical protein